MARSFHAQYDGTMGVEGIAHLNDYDKHVRQNPPAVSCPALRVRTEIAWFAHSYESNSPFQSWCESELYPILEDLDRVIRDGDQAAKQTVATAAANRFHTAKADYREKFCRSNLKDLQRLLTVDFSKASSTVDLIKAVNKCNSLYTVNATRLPPQEEVVELILEKMPPHLATKVSLMLAPLPDDDDNRRYSFRNVGRILGQLMQSREGMLWLQSTGAGVPSSSSSNATVDYNNLAGAGAAANAASRLPHSSASTLAFSHLNDIDKCRALAAVSPHGICPVHVEEPHALKDCPYVLGSKHGLKPRRHVTADAHVAVADETLDTLTDTLADRLQNVLLESFSSAFAAHTGGYHSQHQHGHGGYRQPYTGDRPGFGRGQGPGHQPGFRPQLPACDVCGASSHPTSACWVIRPDKCQDPNTLVAHYSTLPAECKPMFLANLKRHGLLDAIAMQLQAVGADVFPPRPDHVNKDDKISGNAAGSSAPRSYLGMAGVDSTFADVLSCGGGELCASEPLNVINMAATVGQKHSSSEVSERCGACGSPCDCIVKTGHDSMGLLVWQCSKQSSSACTSDKPVSEDHVIQACVAKYAGSLPVSFTKGDPTDSRCMVTTRSQQQRQQEQCEQPAQQKSAGDVQPPACSAEPAAPSASSSQDVPQTAGSAKTDSPKVVASSSRNVGPSACKKAPVSFAHVSPNDSLTGIQQDESKVSGSKPVQRDSLLDIAQGYVLLPIEAAAPYLRRALGGVPSPAETTSTAAAVFTGGDVWFDPSAYSVLSSHKPRFDVAAYRSRKGGVCRLAQFEGKPQDCMFIGPVKGDDSSLVLPKITFTDTCADSGFMRKSFADKHDIAYSKTEGSMMHMRTVGGIVSKPTVTTELVQLVFRRGTSQEHRIICNFIVIDDDCLPYDIILGTPVLRVLACSLDFMTDQMVVRYRYFVHGDSASSFSVPLVTSELPSSDKRSAIVDPAIAATQVDVSNSSLPVAFSAIPGVDVPLFTTCCVTAMAGEEDAMQVDGREAGPSGPTDADGVDLDENLLDFEDEEVIPEGQDQPPTEATDHADQGAPPPPSGEPAPDTGGSDRENGTYAEPVSGVSGSAGPSSSAAATAAATAGSGSAGASSSAGPSSSGSRVPVPSPQVASGPSAAADGRSFVDAVAPLSFEQLPPHLQGFTSHGDIPQALMQGIIAAIGAVVAMRVVEAVGSMVHYSVHSVAAMRQLSANLAASRGPEGLPPFIVDRLIVNLSQLAEAGASMLSFVADSMPGEFSQQLGDAFGSSGVLGVADPSSMAYANFCVYGMPEPNRGGVDAWRWCGNCGFAADSSNHLCGTGRLPADLVECDNVLSQQAGFITMYYKDQRARQRLLALYLEQQEALGGPLLLDEELSLADLENLPVWELQRVVEFQRSVLDEVRRVRRQLTGLRSSSSGSSSGASPGSSSSAGGAGPSRPPPPPPKKLPFMPGQHLPSSQVPFPPPLPPGYKSPVGYGLRQPPPPPRPPPGSPPASCKPSPGMKRQPGPDEDDEGDDKPLISRRHASSVGKPSGPVGPVRS